MLFSEPTDPAAVQAVRAQPYLTWPNWSERELGRLQEVLASRGLSKFYAGRFARDFEAAFAAYHGMGHAVSLSSGTAALHCMYSAAGIGAGDEVIMPVNCYISAAVAALQLNAIPRFADIDPQTGMMDAGAVEALISERTKAVVPVHMYGTPVDMGSISALAQQHGLTLLEDAAQAHGASIGSRLVGTFARMAAYSFFGPKLVCTGEGGMVLTDSAEDAEAVRRYAHKGKGMGWLDYEHIGYSYTMTELQAVFGLSQVEDLTREIERRRQIADIYRESLADVGVEFPALPPRANPVYFKFVFLVPEELTPVAPFMASEFERHNVTVQHGYPCLHLIPWVREKRYSAWDLTDSGRRVRYGRGDCPVAESLVPRQFAAATGGGMSDDEVADTCLAIRLVMESAWRELRRAS